MNAFVQRSKAGLDAALDALDVVHRPDWQPKDGVTHCNQAAHFACYMALGVELPLVLANAQGDWLDSAQGRLAGWDECTAFRAGVRADAGYPTVVTLHEEPHGHIAVIRGVDDHGNLLVWQAGAHNYNKATLRQCFTAEQLNRVRFYTNS